ncbi:hypothetical protein [Moorena bouillonii]|uniref:hypothetical protein n=1 Tax=Moorena bouillonii TaxID=207920 RepID=UPI001E31CC6E|nr:hypothetical protein [Moorena bouillonii]
MLIGKSARKSCSLFPVPYSLLPTPYSLLPTPYSLFDGKAQLAPSGHCEYWDDGVLKLE